MVLNNVYLQQIIAKTFVRKELRVTSLRVNTQDSDSCNHELHRMNQGNKARKVN